jgi:hypothetical protein
MNRALIQKYGLCIDPVKIDLCNLVIFQGRDRIEDVFVI